MTACLRKIILLCLSGVFIVDVALAAGTSLREIDAVIAAGNYDQALALIENGLDGAPGDPALRMRRARINGYIGEDASALDDLDTLRHDYPFDVDYALARAQILARQGRNEEALDDLRHAAALAPDYEAVWKLRFNLLSGDSDISKRRELETVARESAVRFPHADWWQRRESSDITTWTVVAGAGHESLDNNLPSWNRQFVELIQECRPWGRIRAGVARDERFDNADTTLMLGGDSCLDSTWSAGLEVSLASDARFQPDLGYSAYIGRSFENGWLVNLRYRRREYATATVGSAIGTIEKYVGAYRFAYTLGLTRLHGAASSVSHGVTANWYYSDISSIGVSVNTGEEAESIGPGRVLTTDVRGFALLGRREISNRLDLQWWLGLHDQGDFYRRQYLGMAVTLQL